MESFYAKVVQLVTPVEPAKVNDDIAKDTEKKKPESNQFECLYCFDVFTSKEDLIPHQRIHHATKQYLCKWCHVNFSYPGWEYHQKKHTNDKQYFCSSCDKKFYVLQQLQSHLAHHKYTCYYCDQSFVTIKQVKSHNRSVHGIVSNAQPKRKARPKLIKMRTPGTPPHRKIQYPKIRLIHNPANVFECKRCEKQFPKIALLRSHMKQRPNCRPYWCNDCSVKFMQKKLLEKHVRRHMYRCESCSLNFSYKYDLDMHRFNKHMLGFIHIKSEPETGLHCRYCSFICYNEVELQNHVEVCGENQNVIICARCLDVFAAEDSFENHLKVVHQVFNAD